MLQSSLIVNDLLSTLVAEASLPGTSTFNSAGLLNKVSTASPMTTQNIDGRK